MLLQLVWEQKYKKIFQTLPLPDSVNKYSLLVAKRSRTDTDDNLGFISVLGSPSETRIPGRKRAPLSDIH